MQGQRKEKDQQQELLQAEQEQLQEQHTLDVQSFKNAHPWHNKSFIFYMSFISLMFVSLVISWDATSLAVALPVSPLSIFVPICPSIKSRKPGRG